MTALLLAGLLALPAAAADKAAKEDDTKEFVEAVVKTPTAELPPSWVPRFMEADLEALPKALAAKARAKRIELYTLKHIAETKKRGTVRIPDDDCAAPKDTQSTDPGLLLGAGYFELTPDDLQCIKDKSKCTEHDLMCEFTLQILTERDKKGRKKYRFFMHKNDPIASLAGACRGKAGGQTNFFGRANFVCSR